MNQTNQKKPWEIKMSETSNETDILLYGDLGEGWFSDASSKEFAKALAAIPASNQINVRINSNGGDVFTGIAIHSMLKRSKNKIITIVDGIAASAASIIAMAGDIVRMPKGAMLMIHNPWTMVCGDQHELVKVVEQLTKIRDSAVAIYSEKTGLSNEELIEKMDAETYLTAEEAVEQGFADEIEENSSISISLKGEKIVINGLEFEAKTFKNLPILNKLVGIPPDIKPEIKEEQKPMELSLEKIKNEHSDIYNGIFNAGISAERARMQKLDEILDSNVPEVRNLISNARYETGANAESLAFEVIKLQKEHAAKMQPLINLANDTKNLNNIASVSIGIEKEEINPLMQHAQELAKDRAKKQGGNTRHV